MENETKVAAKAAEFTVTEVVTMQLWLEGVLRGQLNLADELIRDGLDFEHYRSLIPADEAEWSEFEKGRHETLRAAFTDVVGRFRQAMAPNQRVDQFSEQLLRVIDKNVGGDAP